MISILAKVFIKDYKNFSDSGVRQQYGILCGAVGIAFNVFLFAFKFFAGKLSGSIAIIADAFNNLSDAGGSIVTLIGFKLAGKKPDPEHPFGHGRLEYISGLIVSFVIILMGVELGKSSIEKILTPSDVSFNVLTGIILIISILTKIYMYYYNHAVGKKINSAAIQATAMDSLSDCIATSAVLATNLVGEFTNFQIDGWCGIAVAGLILLAGYGAGKETIAPLLGTPPDKELVKQIEELVLKSKEVNGIHDMLIHDYGPGRFMVSLHAEVSAKGNILEIHDEIDNIEAELRKRFNCEATIHMDPVALDDEYTQTLKKQVAQKALCIDEKITIHDFRVVIGPTHTNLIFDAVVPHDFYLSDYEVQERLKENIREIDQKFFAVIKIDKSYV